MNQTLLTISLAGYIAATVNNIVHAVADKKAAYTMAIYSLFIGFLFHTTAMIFRIFGGSQLSFLNQRESLVFFTWAVVLIYSLIGYRHRMSKVGAVVLPLVCIVLIYALVLPRAALRGSEGLTNLWLSIHVIFSFLGNLAFAVVFAAGMLYLAQEHQLKLKKVRSVYYKLPSLETLDTIWYRALLLGFPFFTIGMVSGAIRARYVWGSFWNWGDPIEVWSLIAWLIYAVILQGRLMVGWRGRRAAILSIFGFAAVVIIFISVYLFLGELHSAR